MLTTRHPTGLRTAASDYKTLVQQAINKVTDFDQEYLYLNEIPIIQIPLYR